MMNSRPLENCKKSSIKVFFSRKKYNFSKFITAYKVFYKRYCNFFNGVEIRIKFSFFQTYTEYVKNACWSLYNIANFEANLPTTAQELRNRPFIDMYYNYYRIFKITAS
jgi:hypothetical protein